MALAATSTSLIEDIRYSWRALASRPGLTALIVLALGLGMGINVSLFAVADCLFLRPLPYARPQELVAIEQARHELPLDELKGAESFSAVGAFTATNFPVGPRGQSRNYYGFKVSANLFRLLGVQPAMGRLFADDDEGQPVVVLTYDYWRRTSGDPSIIGQTLTINGEKHTVAGVLPEDFVLQVRDANLCLPYRVTDGRLIARLKRGATAAQAQAEVEGLLREQPKPRVRYLTEAFRSNAVPTFLLLQASVGLVLLITCANVGNLLLVASAARRKEFAIRAALGAGRLRIARRLLVESALLGLGGAAAGLILAAASLRFVESELPGNLSRALRTPGGLTIDARVLAFTGAAAMLAVLLFGLAPAFTAWRLDLLPALRGAAANRPRAGRILVAVEMALALMLLIGSGLTLKSLAGLERRNLGFTPGHLLRAAVDFLPARYPQTQQRAAAFAEIHSRIQQLPGVESAGILAPQFFPFGGPLVRGAIFEIEGRPGEQPRAELYTASPDYLRAVHIPLLRGRWFTDADDSRSTPVAVLSDIIVRRYWRGEDPIGRRVRMEGVWLTVVGVTGDVRNPVGTDLQPTAYRPFAQHPYANAVLFIRTSGDPMAMAEPVRGILRAFDPTAPEVRTADVQVEVDRYITPQRFTASLLGFFAGLGLLLTALGVYGVMRYWVSARLRDIGIRVALGADRADVIGLVLRQASLAVLAGIAGGIGGAMALRQVIAAELYDVSPVDPAVIAGVSAALAGAALLAAFLPARRAAAIDPMQVLKQE